MYYEPFDPNQRVVEVGGEKYAVSPMEVGSLPGGGGTDIGVGKVSTSGTHDVITMTPEGPQRNTLSTTRQPAITGSKGRGGLLSHPAGGGGPQSLPHPTSAPSGGSTDASGKPLGLPPGQYNQQMQVARPLRVTGNQIFGDPQNPSFQGLVTYGDVMNSPQSVQRVGTAARFMLEDLSQVESKHGGLMGLIALYGGLPQAIAEAQSDATRDALASLSPREQELLNAEMDAYGTIIGLRSITKGQASQYTARSLERELPIPGVSAFDAYTFYDKLARLGEEVESGAKGVSPQVLPERDFYQHQYDRLIEMRDMNRKGVKSKSLPHPTQTSPTKPTKDPLGLYN